MQGVLCLDTNKSDFFLSEETALWRDDLVAFLINIALSEKLRAHEALIKKTLDENKEVSS
jgi:hypothetical protein